MNNKKALFSISLLMVMVGVFALSGQPYSKYNNPQFSVSARSTVEEIPEHVRYMFLFNYHHSNMKKAADLERHGKARSGFRSMVKRRAGLSDQEAIILDRITTDCEQELARQDAKAKVVIDAFRARYPVGDLPAGVSLPPPPPELTTMQEERNSIILRARERLRTQLADKSFARIDAFVEALAITSEHPGSGPR